MKPRMLKSLDGARPLRFLLRQKSISISPQLPQLWILKQRQKPAVAGL